MADKTHIEHLLATRSLEIRADSSSSEDRNNPTSSDYCEYHKDSNLCEKPVSSNTLIIAISIVLPLVLIACVLGYFLYRNYRKDKKESMEHDPDFDENGEATAIPDVYFGGVNPFQSGYENQSVLGQYKQQHPPPPRQMQQNLASQYSPYGQLPTQQATNLPPPKADPYGFILPYTHQTGSKSSLDDYTRSFYDLQGYTTPSSASIHQLDQSAVRSPTKSNLRYEKRLESTENLNSTKPYSEQYSMEDLSSTGEKSDHRGLEKEEQFHDGDRDIEKTASADLSDSTDRNISPFEDHETTATYTQENDSQDNFRFSTTDTDKHDSDATSVPPPTKASPRLSRFNLLKNDSDAEDDVEVDEENQVLSNQQQEELKRMRSVYKVYFEEQNASSPGMQQQQQPQQQQQNDQIDSARFSTASSVYDSIASPRQQHPEEEQIYTQQFNQNYQQHYGQPIDPQLYQQVQKQQYANYIQQQRHMNRPSHRHRHQHSQQQLQPAKIPSRQASREFSPPLDTVPNATAKYRTKSPPIQMRPYMPFDDFQQGTGYYESSYDANSPMSPPSATQVSRNSVVMVNPVTEITKARKFVPAGSLAQNNNGSQHSFGISELEYENDLIPGSRKSDIRRVMNGKTF
ncbi:uncharacterized protein J8A68_001963 [[Candida] subhashii]|uniref:Uncharacterized protein n=1 Tax=[Candida] subhashii TaxID=561895 RepID=A0A8J5QK26_9ASCO|nr:uncharacterized protein J8A68_001963 [[Candida] subhashii]KAG7664512.1 hypothetical protein J8A68_001963 [[Candida] subhashii]